MFAFFSNLGFLGRFFLGLGLAILAQALTPRPQSNIQRPKDSEVPTARRGTPLRKRGGTGWVVLEIAWHGDFDTEEVTESGGKK